MNPKLLSISNIGPFQNTSVNLDTPGLLTAISGANGAGKSTLLSMIAYALYRELPDRGGNIARLCSADSAVVDLTFAVAGQTYTAKHVIKPKARSATHDLFRGEEVIATEYTEAFDTAIEELIGSKAIAFASCYGAQNSRGNFLAMDKAERKKMFIEMIGVERFNQYVEIAKGKNADAKILLAGKEAQINAVELTAGMITKDRDIEEAERAIEDKQFARSNQTKRIKELEATLVGAVSARKEITGAQQRLNELRSRKSNDESAVVSLARRLHDAESKAAMAATFRADKDTLAQQETTITDRLATENAILAGRAAVQQQVDSLNRERQHCMAQRAERQRLDARHAEIETRMEQIKSECAVLGDTRSRRDNATSACAETATELRAAQATLHDGLERNATRERELRQATTAKAAAERELKMQSGLAAAIDSVPCKGSMDCSYLAIAKDAKNAIPTLEVEVVKQDKIVRDLLATEVFDPAPTTATISQLEELLTNQEIDRAEAEAAEKSNVALQSEMTTLVVERAGIVQSLAGLPDSNDYLTDIDRRSAELKKQSDDMKAATQNAQTFTAELSAIRSRISLADNGIATATAAAESIGVYQTQIDSLQREIDTTQSAIDKTSDTLAALESSLPTESDIANISADIAACEALHKTISQQIIDLTAAVREYKNQNRLILEARSLLEVRRAERQELKDTADAYATLEKDFGLTGIQSFLLDASGPEISLLCNDILSGCFGGQFSIAFRTREEKASKRGEFKDDFSVVVLDSLTDKVVDASDLSGGEQAIVKECLSLAIGLYNRQNNAKGWEILIRDEPGAALDKDSAPAYINALRKAAQLGGYHKVYYVAHNEDMIGMADSVLQIHNGQVS